MIALALPILLSASVSLILSNEAQAAFTNISVSGVSSSINLETTTDTTIKPTIYGGYALPTSSTCVRNNVDVCNSCDQPASAVAGSGLLPCNLRSIYPSLNAHFVMTSSQSGLTGANIAVKNSTVNMSYANLAIAGNVISFDIPWSELCAKLGGGAGTCETSFTGEFTVTTGTSSGGGTTGGDEFTFNVVLTYVDTSASTDLQFTDDCPNGNLSGSKTNLGYCHSEFIRGDEKVYAVNQFAAKTYPTSASGGSITPYSALVYFYEKGTAGESDTAIIKRISNKSADPKVISVKAIAGSPPTIADNRVTGLSNETRYCFIAANQDQGGNIYYFTPIPAAGSTDEKNLCATPSKVIGLLDDKSCFIATAAFGSEMAPEVDTFRHFRNEFLLKNSWGRAFVRTYYKYSPPLAHFIAQSDLLRAGVRMLLWPLLIFAQMSIELGVGMSLLLLTLSLLALTTMYREYLKRRKA